MPAFDAIIHKNSAEFFAQYVRKTGKAYIIVLSVIMAFECFMTVRGLVLFDLARSSYRLYLISYVLLFTASLIALVFVVRNGSGAVTPGTLTAVLHLYCTAIIVWGLLISYLDLCKGRTPIVYLTVIMSFGGLSVIHPLYFAANVLLSFGVLLSFNGEAGVTYFQAATNGVYINLSVFVIVSLLLTIRNYSVSRRDLEMSGYLQDLSLRDQLTGIPNRRMFDDRLDRIGREDGEALLGIIDLDRFKNINDSYGHYFGDVCLTRTAACLQEQFGADSFRIGGDEFAVLCPPCSEADISARIGAVNRALQDAFPGRQISISAGFCRREAGSGKSVNAVLEAADNALTILMGTTAATISSRPTAEPSSRSASPPP